MLIVNDKPLDFKNTSDPTVAKVREGFEKIRKRGFPIVFRDGRGIQINPTGAKEPGKRYSFSLVAAVSNQDTGTEYWRYSKTPANRDGKYKNKRFTFFDVLVLNENDIDFAYYLLYLSDAVKSGAIKLVDKKEDAKKLVAAKKKMVSTRYFLYDESSDYYEAEQLLRLVALSFGVAKADDPKTLSFDEVKIKLEQTIEAAEMNGDRERDEMAFRIALEGSGLVKMRATVQNAIDVKLVEFTEPYWILLNEKGGKQATLCTVPTLEYDRRVDVLVEYLQRNAANRELIETTLNQEGAFNQPKDLTMEMLLDMSFPQKKSWAKRYGYKKFNPKEDEIDGFLKSKILT
jgi:hypothetical protein